MRCRPRGLLAASCLAGPLAALAAMSVAREPIKRASTRRGYDFTWPRPGKILPNPTEGVGIPPQLRAYVTAKDMAASDSPSAGTPTGQGRELGSQVWRTPSQTGPRRRGRPASQDAEPFAVRRRKRCNGRPAAGERPRPHRGPERQAGPAAPAAADAWRSSMTTQVSRHVEAALAKQVGALGLDGRFTYKPSAAAQADPKIEVLERRNWDRLVKSLGTSWRAWQAEHSGATAVGAAPKTPEASGRCRGRLQTRDDGAKGAGRDPPEGCARPRHRRSTGPGLGLIPATWILLRAAQRNGGWGHAIPGREAAAFTMLVWRPAHLSGLKGGCAFCRLRRSHPRSRKRMHSAGCAAGSKSRVFRNCNAYRR